VSSIVNVLPSLNEGFRKVVDTVFSDLKYRSVTGCRLIYEENIFQAGLFVDSNWNCRSDIIVDDVVHGSFEVWYSEDMPYTSADNFHNDGGFVDSVTRSLGIFVEMKLVENDLNIFKSISYKVNYGISILDMDGNIIYVNEAFSQLHGYSVEELLGTHFLMFYNESQVPRLKCLLDNLLNSDCCMAEEVWHMRKNGNIFPAILECDLILDSDNVPSYIFVALKDITEIKKADDALKRAMSIADAANCSKSEFLANVSHELRTPLNAIVGFSEILLDGRCGDLNDVQRRYLQNVSNSGNHLSDIITKILEISNIEAGNAEVNVGKFKILHSVLEVKESLMHSILLKDISFVCELDPDLPQICVDKIKFKHILHNLLTNAVKFTSDRG
ncbi:MAG: PAS domain-containing protein, partial [Methanococcoides sp.]|nr:PAS domain-containing protein [Methanococcoides sp.]